MKRWLLLTVFCASASHADDSPTPQAIAMNCRTCHQPAGADGDIANLSQFGRAELRQALLDLKHNPNPSATIMPRLVKGYSDQQLQAVADYLTEQ